MIYLKCFVFVILCVTSLVSQGNSQAQHCQDYSNRCYEGNPQEFCNTQTGLLMCPKTCGICRENSYRNIQPVYSSNSQSTYEQGENFSRNYYQPIYSNKHHGHSNSNYKKGDVSQSKYDLPSYSKKLHDYYPSTHGQDKNAGRNYQLPYNSIHDRNYQNIYRPDERSNQHRINQKKIYNQNKMSNKDKIAYQILYSPTEKAKGHNINLNSIYSPAVNTRSQNTHLAEKILKHIKGKGGNVKGSKSRPAERDSKYNSKQDEPLEEESRHYIHIGNTGSDTGRIGENEELPVFELGPSSRNFITKQVDKIMMTLNLMQVDNGNSNISQLLGRSFTNGINSTTILLEMAKKKGLAIKKKITKAKDCNELHMQGKTFLKNAQIFPYSVSPYNNITVRCDQEQDGGRWTIIQKRNADFKTSSRADFDRNWNDYVKGFGKLALDKDGEYWIGLEALHDLTTLTRQELYITMVDHAGNKRWAKYSNFSVGGPETNYKLTVGGYSGDAGDSLKYHNNQPFSTSDKDHDQLSLNCAEKYSGGWWFRGCQRSNLNGVHAYARGSPTDNGIIWATFKGFDISLHTVTMMIRPVTQRNSN